MQSKKIAGGRTPHPFYNSGCARWFLAKERRSSPSKRQKPSCLRRFEDVPIIGRADIEIKNIAGQEININDGQEAYSEKAYIFEFRYNEKPAGLEGSLPDTYAVSRSRDGKKVYWNYPAKDWYMDYDSRPTYHEPRQSCSSLWGRPFRYR